MTCDCDVSVVKRSDDVSPLESVVQQQAATIQTLQAQLSDVTNRLAAVESGLQKEGTVCPTGFFSSMSSRNKKQPCDRF